MFKLTTLSALALLAGLAAASPTPALSLHLGLGGQGLVNLGSDTNNSDPVNVNVDTGSLLGGGNSSGGSQPTTAGVTIGGSGGLDAGAAFDLSGAANTPEALVHVGVLGIDADVLLDLFGDGGTGVPPGGDDNGGGGGGGGGTHVASLDGNLGCFTPNAEQLAQIAGRHSYTSGTMASWANVTNLKIVPIDLCTSAKRKTLMALSANANIVGLQTYLLSHSSIRSALAAQGYSVGDVVAVDKSGSTLIVYVVV